MAEDAGNVEQLLDVFVVKRRYVDDYVRAVEVFSADDSHEQHMWLVQGGIVGVGFSEVGFLQARSIWAGHVFDAAAARAPTRSLERRRPPGPAPSPTAGPCGRWVQRERAKAGGTVRRRMYGRSRAKGGIG